MKVTRKSFWWFQAKLAGLTLSLMGLAYLIMPHIGSGRGEVFPFATRTDMEQIGIALDAFQLDCGRFPTTAEGLNAMITQTTNLPDWRGPYLKGCSAVPLDPWGHPYVYICPGLHNPKTFDLYSLGGKTGDSNYLNNWTHR